MKSLLMSAVGVGLVLGGSPAMAENTVYVTVEGCRHCTVTAAAVSVQNDDRTIYKQQSMFNGTTTFWIPEEYPSVSFEITPKSGESGWNSVTIVAPLYRGFQPGQKVSVKQARKSKWAQGCVAITQPETWLDVRVVKNKNPKKYKKGDPTWTRYSLLAWASPQVQGVGQWMDTYKGRTSAQNTFCGLGPYR